MHRMTLTAETLHPAPLARQEREQTVRAILVRHSIFPRRWAHASSAGLTITYAHLSEAADGPVAATLLAEALDWDDTEVGAVGGMVAVTTHRG